MNDITRLLEAVRQGNSRAGEELLPLVYAELRQLARAKMAREQPGHTLQPTALVHEAFLKVVGTGSAPTFEDRRHFFNAAANAMRRILIDRHRRVGREKHGGLLGRQDIEGLEFPAASEFRGSDFEHLDGLLDELRAHNERWSEVVHLRYFVGLTIEQAAETMGVGLATVKSDWNFARAWLRARLKQLGSSPLEN